MGANIADNSDFASQGFTHKTAASVKREFKQNPQVFLSYLVLLVLFGLLCTVPGFLTTANIYILFHRIVALGLVAMGMTLVITDHQMPEMTGWDLCTRMCQMEAHAQTPVIFLTAKSLELDLARMKRELGVVAAFAKPFSPSELVRTVEECLASVTNPSDG